MHHHAFDGIVASHGTESTTRIEPQARLPDVRQRLAFGNHHGHLDKTVARGKREEIGVLHHIDAIGLVVFPVKDMAEDAIIGRNEVLSLGFHHHMRTFSRLDRVNSNDVNGTWREAAIAVFQRETCLSDIERLDFVGNINDSGIGQLRQNRSFNCRSIIILRSPIACYCDNCHRLQKVV